MKSLSNERREIAISTNETHFIFFSHFEWNDFQVLIEITNFTSKKSDYTYSTLGRKPCFVLYVELLCFHEYVYIVSRYRTIQDILISLQTPVPFCTQIIQQTCKQYMPIFACVLVVMHVNTLLGNQHVINDLHRNFRIQKLYRLQAIFKRSKTAQTIFLFFVKKKCECDIFVIKNVIKKVYFK